MSVFKPGLFKGCVAIVTGGGTGIGRAITYELLTLGMLNIIWFIFGNFDHFRKFVIIIMTILTLTHSLITQIEENCFSLCLYAWYTMINSKAIAIKNLKGKDLKNKVPATKKLSFCAFEWRKRGSIQLCAKASTQTITLQIQNCQ